MRQYLDLMKNILENGEERSDRTGTGTKSIFGTQLRFDLRKGFPAMTTKRLFFKGIVHELLWFLNGDTNVKYLKDNGVGIWDEWADENGDLGPVYGKQWRKWEYMKHTPTKEIWDDYYVKTQIDQVANIIEQIKTNPYSRRLLVSAWNPTVLPDVNLKPHENPALGLQALPPCHYSWQCYVNNGRLSLLFNMRSIDTFLGLSFNIASYALLCHMIAHVCRLEVGDLIFSGGDTHLYLNHIEQAKLQLTREPYDLPTLKIKRKVENIDDFKYEDFELENYKAHPHIKADIAIQLFGGFKIRLPN